MTRKIQLDPVCFYNNMTLNLGEVLEMPNAEKMKNPSSTPMLVDEIRFECLETYGSNDRWVQACTYVEILAGRTPLTQGFVPIWMLSKVLNQGIEEGSVSGTNIARPRTTWRLPKPMYLPANEYFTFKFWYRNDLLLPSADMFASGVETIKVTVLGRSLGSDQPIPDLIDIPYVCSWTASPVILAENSEVSYTAKCDDPTLINPFNEPLHVQRFLGRIAIHSASLQTAVWGEDFTSEARGVFGNQGLMVRMNKSDGTICIRDETPFHAVFTSMDRAWNVNTLLGPKQFYKVYLRGTSYQTPIGGVYYIPFISMIGCRQVVAR